MVDSSISDRRYTYLHDCKWPSEAIDTHHVVMRKRYGKVLFVCVFTVVLVATAFYLFLVNESIVFFLWSFLLSAVFFRLMLQKLVMKESVIVIPSFGIQLETHYITGRITCRFVPIGKILKPVLLECVTPVTCYWSLSLILREETELMLVFKELHPPVKMLVPIWKALCLACGSSDTFIDDVK